MTRKKIFVVSPLSGKTDQEIEENIKWAQLICRKIILDGDNVFASHLFYPQFLMESVLEERALGIECGSDWMPYCDEVHVFMTLRGITTGMKQEIDEAKKLNKIIKYIFPAEFYNLSERNRSYQRANMKKCVTCVWGNLKTEKCVKCKNCNIFNPEATVCNYDEVPQEIPE